MSSKDPKYRNIFDTLTFEPRANQNPDAKPSRQPGKSADSDLFSDEELGTAGEIAAIRRLTASMAEESKSETEKAGATPPAPTPVPVPVNQLSFTEIITRAGLGPKILYSPADTVESPIIEVSPRKKSPPMEAEIDTSALMETEIDISALREAENDFNLYLKTINVRFRRIAVYLLLEYLFSNDSIIDLGNKKDLMNEYRNNGFNETFGDFKDFDNFMFQIFHWQIFLHENQLLRPDVQKSFYTIFEKFLKS
jgi:hypothetical protein